MHRPIISPLLTLLFQRRIDCAFVISTHDVLLPIDNPESRTLLVRSCVYDGQSVTGWDADLVVTPKEIDDTLKQDILGARRKLLFVEGEEHSLDKPIYSLLFPSASVVAKQSCRDVEHAVSGIRDAAELHWLSAFGIVDSDNKDDSQIAKLKARGIYCVPAVSVESIYYHPFVQQRVCERQTKVTGDNAATMIGEAQSKAFGAITPHARRLSERVAETKIRSELMRQLPRRKDIATAPTIEVQIDVAEIVNTEEGLLTSAIRRNDFAFLVARYPVRETPALGVIAQTLGFQSQNQYESAVRQLLIDDGEALSYVRDLFGTLAHHIASV